MNTTAVTEKFRYLGVTDECVECQRCGKVDLKATIVLAVLDTDGNEEEITYFGSTCAARALAIKGGGRAALQYARTAHHQTLTAAQDARRMLAYYHLPETGAVAQVYLEAAGWRYEQRHPSFCAGMTNGELWAQVLDMLSRQRAAIAEAALIGRRA
jgi:hypothetical protein